MLNFVFVLFVYALFVLFVCTVLFVLFALYCLFILEEIKVSIYLSVLYVIDCDRKLRVTLVH